MKERPILFSAPLVRALLAGTKTQTRRIVKLQPRTKADIGHRGAGMPFIRNPEPLRPNLPCPYGQPGDRLWVRETFAAWRVTATGKRSHVMGFRADINDEKWDGFGCDDPWWLDAKWEPSIHMPRAFSRITLEIVSVRVERLQQISEEDARAEGVANADSYRGIGVDDAMANRYAFRELWESISGAGSWDANPWVWVVEFKRVEQSA